MVTRHMHSLMEPDSWRKLDCTLIKNGTCQNNFCASETNVGLLPHEELPYQ